MITELLLRDIGIEENEKADGRRKNGVKGKRLGG